MLDSSNEEKIKIIKQCIYDCGYDIYYQKISGIYNYYFNPWQTYELVQKKLETYDIKIRNMFKLLLLGEPISEESAINSLGREFIENLLDVNFLINNNGILRSNGYSLVAYRERYFVASIPYDYPRCTGKQDIYIGLDSYKLADILPNRKIDRHLDLCSGTGIQSIMNAANFSEGYVVEKNKKVIPALKFNIILNGFNEKIKVINGDLFEKIRNEKFDLITANPPFIPIPNQFDFPMAGDGGEDGLKIINRIIEGLNEHLNNNGEAIAIYMHMIPEFAIFTGIFMLLRTYAGGVHLNSFGSCFICSVTVQIIAMYFNSKYKFTVGTAWLLILVSAILILKAAPVECINRELDDTEKEHCKKVTMKVLIAVIVFAGCCTLARIPDILSLVALTSFIILISQYVGILKYKIEKSKNKRR